MGKSLKNFFQGNLRKDIEFKLILYLMPKENSKGDFKSPLFNFNKSTFQF